MTFSSMYMGMSPFEAPATYTLLQYAEYAKGVFYPIGGFQTLVAAFEKVAVGFGCNFIYNTSVTKIIMDPENKKKVRGVQLDNGEVIYADAVVSNVDLVWTVSEIILERGQAGTSSHGVTPFYSIISKQAGLHITTVMS